MHQFSNPFSQYYNYNKSLFPSFGFPPFANLQEEEIKIIGKDEFYRNKVANLIKVNEALGTFNNENNKPASFFENPDFQKREPFPDKSNQQASTLNKFNNLFDFGLINPNTSNKKVSCKKREKMRKNPLASAASEKVIPFIGSNIETLLLNAKKPLALEDLLDCDGFLGSTKNKRIVIGHKRTKTLYKLNKNLKLMNVKIKLERNTAENEEKTNDKKKCVEKLYAKLNLDELDLVENENVLILEENTWLKSEARRILNSEFFN